MSDPVKPVVSISTLPRPKHPDGEKVVCERCGGDNVYRMHAVWRCADCGYKTDCCGW
jgi:ribosomal protein L37AE/L43A